MGRLAHLVDRNERSAFIRVPFRDPRSSTNTSAVAFEDARACTLETNVSSGIETPHPARGPMVSSAVDVEGPARSRGARRRRGRHAFRGGLALALTGTGGGAGAAGAAHPETRHDRPDDRARKR